MFITVVNGQIAHRHPSLVEVANSMRTLDSVAASYVEVFQYFGTGNDTLRNQTPGYCEKGEGITPTNLEKYYHRYP